MATANFTTTDVSVVYGITIENDWDWDNAIDNIDSYLSDKFGDEFNGDRNVGNIGSISRHDGNMFTIGIDVILRSGYYEDANVDLVVSIESDYGSLTLGLDDLDDSNVVDWIADELIYNDCYTNLGMCKMQAPNILDKLQAKVSELLTDVEQAIGEVSHYKLNCIGHFSNGGAVYKKIS